MIVGSENSWLVGTPKPGDARPLPERTAPRPDSAATATPAAAQAAVSESQRVASTHSLRSQNGAAARSPDEREADARRFAREAPNGERPRFIAKGQMLNVLI